MPPNRSPHPPTPFSGFLRKLGRRGENAVEHSPDSDAVYRKMSSQVMVQFARELRQRPTTAEQVLWQALRNRRLNGLKFRRQHPIPATAYVADFLCYEAHLVLELDGEIHQYQLEDDLIRQQNIEERGFHILRFTNDQVFGQLENVLFAIFQHASSTPLHEGEGQG